MQKFLFGVNIDSIGADSLGIAAVFLFVLFSLWNQILRFVARTPADSVQEGKAIPHGNTDLRTEFASSSCFATNDGTNMSLNQVDDSVRDAACFGIHQDALLAVQLTDHKKFLPPVRAQARKGYPRSDQSIDCIKISLYIVELAVYCGFYLAAAGLLLLGDTKEVGTCFTTIISWAVCTKI